MSNNTFVCIMLAMALIGIVLLVRSQRRQKANESVQSVSQDQPDIATAAARYLVGGWAVRLAMDAVSRSKYEEFKMLVEWKAFASMALSSELSHAQYEQEQGLLAGRIVAGPQDSPSVVALAEKIRQAMRRDPQFADDAWEIIRHVKFSRGVDPRTLGLFPERMG